MVKNSRYLFRFKKNFSFRWNISITNVIYNDNQFIKKVIYHLVINKSIDAFLNDGKNRFEVENELICFVFYY